MFFVDIDGYYRIIKIINGCNHYLTVDDYNDKHYIWSDNINDSLLFNSKQEAYAFTEYYVSRMRISYI